MAGAIEIRVLRLIIKVLICVQGVVSTKNNTFMELHYFIGIDVSKETLDFTLLKGVERLFHMQVCNSAAGIKSFIKQLKSHYEVSPQECLFCLEHTGIYNTPLLAYFEKHPCKVWLDRVAGAISHSHQAVQWPYAGKE